VAVVILVGALIAQASAYMTADRNAGVKVDEARETWESRHEAMRAHSIAIASVTYNGGQDRLTILVDNVGLVTLNATEVDVLLDGMWHSTNITLRQVDAADSRVWGPGQQLELRVTVDPKPIDVWVLTPYGLADVQRGGF
jgi:archaellum component FlaF (FlaF/FlaG flagellin family)